MNETNETVFRKEWKGSLLGAPVVFLVGIVIAFVIGIMGHVGGAGVVASIAGMGAVAMLFDGTMCLISPARVVVTPERLVYKSGLSGSYTLTRAQSTADSWAIENEMMAIRFDDGNGLALKNFNGRAIYDAMNAYGWTGLPDWPTVASPAKGQTQETTESAVAKE